MDDELEVLKQLFATPEIFEQIDQLTGTELQRQTALRKHFDANLVRNALLLSELRKRGRAKFSKADQMWFDRTGLEQATAEQVAIHKAQRFSNTTQPIYDLCCGIGSDSIAMAASNCEVISVDQSPAACLRTKWNAEVYGVSERIQTRISDVTTLELSDSPVHIDPDRRAGRKRAIRLEDYAPPLEFLLGLQTQTPGGAIKLSPASNFGGKFSDCEIELISLNGECKEATIWYGELAGTTAQRATVLPAGFSLAGNPWEFRPHVGKRGQFVYDPDPAIVRSGLLDQLVEKLQLRRLDDAEEYLTSDELVDSPAITPFEVVEELPNNNREIRRAIRSGDYGEVEIKSRHVPTDVEAIRRKLSLSGKDKIVLIFARLAGRTRALLCKRLERQEGLSCGHQ